VNLAEGQDVMAKFCDILGIEFKVTNRGHHWQFRPGHRSTIAYADWWPSSGKFIPNGNKSNSLQIVLYKDLMDELEAIFPPITGPTTIVHPPRESVGRLILRGALSPAGITGIMLIFIVIVACGTAMGKPWINLESLSAVLVCGFVLIAVAFSQFVRSRIDLRRHRKWTKYHATSTERPDQHTHSKCHT
jgi:hypothetical protein